MKFKEKEKGSAESKVMASEGHFNKNAPKFYYHEKIGHMKLDCRLLGSDTKNTNWKGDFSKRKTYTTMKSERNPSNSENGYFWFICK